MDINETLRKEVQENLEKLDTDGIEVNFDNSKKDNGADFAVGLKKGGKEEYIIYEPYTYNCNMILWQVWGRHAKNQHYKTLLNALKVAIRAI